MRPAMLLRLGWAVLMWPVASQAVSASLPAIMTNEAMGGPSPFTMLYTTSIFHDANPKAMPPSWRRSRRPSR
jgi:hypothetical protein